MRRNWCTLAILLCGFLIQEAPAEETRLELWSNGAPGAMGSEEKDKPNLTVYPAPKDKANGCGIVVVPGGGYGHLAVGHEGVEIAEWLNSVGVSAFVLRYRIAPYRHPAPMLDVQRAIRTVRHNAQEWNVDPQRIGIIGFSAGGHLTSTAATHFDAGNSKAEDPIDQQSCRPDFAILGYPVISLVTEFTHQGSRRNLLGETPDEELVKSLSNELQVTKDTPPTFLFHTTEDTVVPPENSVLFYLALRKAKVPCELHIYETGRHGLGLARTTPGMSHWPESCVRWMQGRGFLGKNP